MKIRKIRGHNRRLKQIDNWVTNCKKLDLTSLKEYKREYVKFWVHPWSGISLKNSSYPQPKRLARKKLLEGLIEIYQNWKQQLDQSGEEYYLKIWLFSPNLSKSQVVCAIGESKDNYNNAFSKTETFIKFNINQFPNQLNHLNWESYLDELIVFKSDFSDPEMYATQKEFEEDQHYLSKKIKQSYKTSTIDEDILYHIKQGYVWVGSK